MTTARLDDHGLPIHGLPTMACRPRAFRSFFTIKSSLKIFQIEKQRDQKYDEVQKDIRMR